MATKGVNTAPVPHEASQQSVKIPGFFERLCIKLKSITQKSDTKIVNQVKPLSERTYAKLENVGELENRFKSAGNFSLEMRKYKKTLSGLSPTPELIRITSEIRKLDNQVSILDNHIRQQSDIAKDYMPYSDQHRSATKDIEVSQSQRDQLQSNISDLKALKNEELVAMGEAKGITKPTAPAEKSLSQQEEQAFSTYKAAAKSIITAAQQKHQSNPSKSLGQHVQEVSALYVPFYLKDAMRSNLEAMLEHVLRNSG